MVTEMCSSINPSSLLHSFGVSTTSSLGAFAIALIAFSNIFGTIYAGWLGQIYQIGRASCRERVWGSV